MIALYKGKNMQYGYFDDQNREYVIQTPRTPYPWINYLGSENFFGIVSNTGGGYSFYKDARLRRLTRYRYNNVPVDLGGRYYYINDGGDVWNPGWKPVKADLTRYECRHGLGYTRITGARGGVEAELLMFVPLGQDCEAHRLRLRNLTEQGKRLKVFSLAEFCLWNAYNDMTDFQRNFSIAEVEVEGSVIYHKTEYRERRDHFAFYSVNAPIAGFDTQLHEFTGLYNGFDAPAAVMEGRSRDSVASGWQAIGSHMLDVPLAPGEARDFVFVLGYAENREDEKFIAPGVINKKNALALIERFPDGKAVEDAARELSAYWNELLSVYDLRTPDEKLARMVNIWNPYQCMTTFNMSRSTSLFESGIGRGMGFRDSNQDVLGFVHLIPARARERILDIAATQFRDGSAYHQYQPLTKKGNHDIGSGFNDDPLWLIAAVAAYIKETGDFAILDESVPYDSDPNDTGSLLEHLFASYTHVMENLGPHGLPLIGRADWNDCLNLNSASISADESSQTNDITDGRVAESVMIAGMFVLFVPDLTELLERKGEAKKAAETRRSVDAMREAVLAHGYDGDWFLRAYDASGRKVGGKACAEGKIFIESQGFCVMAGIGADDGKAARALASVREHLDTEHGILLQQPAYSRYDPHLGEITSYPPGYKENAAIFCHNNPWIVCAEAVLGNGARAFELYRKIAPAYREPISERHRMEPYVYAQMIAGRDAANFGEAKNSWLTGTAAWNFVAISQYILGIKPDFDGLRIDPRVPPDWESYRVNRRFRGAVYEITVRNPRGVCRGVASVSVDGKEIDGNLLPVFDRGTHTVEVTLG